MNDQSYNEPRLDETPAVEIMNVSYCIGRMEVPIRGTAQVHHSGVLDHNRARINPDRARAR